MKSDTVRDRMEILLLEWAAWVTVGDGSGYARISVLHEDWTPPTAGQTPTMKVSANHVEAQRLHKAIGQLSLKLRNTVVVCYCMPEPQAKQAARLACQPDTIRARIREAKRQLAQALAADGQ